MWAVDTLVETIDFTSANTSRPSISSYGTSSTWGNWTIVGAANNSKNWSYLRIGGGKNNSSPSTITRTTSGVSQAVDYIEINHEGRSGTTFTITSITAEASNSTDFTTPTATKTVSNPDISSAGKITISFDSQVAANSYYKITIVWTQTNSKSNVGLNTDNVKFYQIASSDLTSFAFANATPSTTLVKNGENDYSASYTQAVSFTPNDYTGTITYSIDDDNSNIGANTLADINSVTGEVTVLASANESSTIVVKATGAADSKYNAPSAATYTLTVNAAIAYTITAVPNNNSYGSVSVSGATITATPNAGYKVPATGGYTVSSGTATVVNNGDGTFTVTPTSDCTITINFEEKATPTFAFASNTASVIYGNDVTEPALTNEESTGDVTYTSSNEAVATVDATTGEVTAVSVGTTVITATVTEDANYKTTNATYTLTVNENTTASGAANSETIFYESFDKCNSSGGNDNNWAGLSGNANLTDDNTDNAGWTASNQKKACDKCAYFGSSSNAGNPVSPAITFDSSKTYTLSFKAANWGTSGIGDGGTLTVKVGETTVFDDITLNVGGVDGWGTYSDTFTGVSGNQSISFTKSSKRFFLDEVTISAPSESYYITATIPASGWGTYCSPYKLDLSNEATEITAYAVTGFNAEEGKITFTKVIGVVPAKTPLVIYGEAGSKKIAVDQTEATGTAPVGNLLVGYLSPTYYDGDRSDNTLFALSGGNFHKLTAGTIKANKAVLSMSTTEANKVPDNSEGKFTFVFNDGGTTKINLNVNDNLNCNATRYNLAGQKVSSSYKGIVIVNGKKYFVK